MNKNINIITQCPECGRDEIDAHDNFCTMCGTDLQPYKITLRCCKRSLLIMHAYNYCPFCGGADPLSVYAGQKPIFFAPGFGQ